MPAAAVASEPLAGEFRAPAHWRCIDFISDLHLAEDTPNTFDAWAEYLGRTRADAVFILGDLFDSWVGDDARAAGFEARCTRVLRDTSARRSVAFMVGNRDFLVGKDMLSDCGVEPLPDPVVLVAFGERVLLSHGDALCLADVDYQRFRAQVRNPGWQAGVLALPLAERQVMARHARAESERRQSGEFGDLRVDIDLGAACQWMLAAGTPTLIHGHTHRPGTEAFATGFTRHVLSDWELDHGASRRAEVLRWQPGGITRLALADAGRPD